MSEDRIKQIIAIRHDLHLRAGKAHVQASHASMAFLVNAMQIGDFLNANPGQDGRINIFHGTLTDVQRQWIEDIFTKVCVRVDSEEELLDIFAQAQAAGVAAYLIEDAGLTEFHGVKTKTCLALGPDYSSKLDPITGHLRLL